MIVDITSELPDIDNVEVLINNAGIHDGPSVIDTNLKATIAVTEKYAFTNSIHSVLFMASSSASNGAEFPEYAASKGGVVTYMKNTALRLAKYGATSNSISAGGVYTPLNSHIMDDPDLMEQCLNETLLHRWASADEIAELAYYLTNVNKSMTGQDLLIDNGEQLKSNFIW
jgi:3-oxoacyl-[acyl-carrier protein] reductase